MSSLIVAANRGPATLSYGKDGELVVRHGAGGLAPSLARALSGTDGLWIAAAMTPAEEDAAKSDRSTVLASGIELRLVDLSSEVRAAAYRVIANGTLWFLFHGMFDHVYRPVFDRYWHEAWRGYRAYNEAFAAEIAKYADQGATVVVNDYHLALVGTYLAANRPDLKTVHFTHTPFCSPDELAVLPREAAVELCTGLASFGACGFHIERWADAFRACSQEMLGMTPATFTAPLGVDAGDLVAIAESAKGLQRRRELLDWLGDRQLIFRSDRVELSKNLVRGFLAFEELLITKPQWRNCVVFLARAYPSREELSEYLAYRSEVERVVQRINDRFSDLAQPPIVLAVEDDFEATIAALSCSDVLLINPIRDGMNLVAKEGPIINQRDGVLLLSREVGAFPELRGDAIAIEPFNVTGTAAAMHEALSMDPTERAERASRLALLAAANAPAEWFSHVLAEARVLR